MSLFFGFFKILIAENNSLICFGDNNGGSEILVIGGGFSIAKGCCKAGGGRSRVPLVRITYNV